MLHTNSQQQIHNINTNYLNLLKKTLNIKLTLQKYTNHQKTINTLTKNKINIILSHLITSPPLNNNITTTKPLIITFPTLITTLHNSIQPLTSPKPINITQITNYPPNKIIHQSFPKTTIISFTNLYQTLTSISTKHNNYFINNNIITNNIISHYFTHSLNIIKYYNSPHQYNFFLTRKKSIILNKILNKFINTLTNKIHYKISQN